MKLSAAPIKWLQPLSRDFRWNWSRTATGLAVLLGVFAISLWYSLNAGAIQLDWAKLVRYSWLSWQEGREAALALEPQGLSQAYVFWDMRLPRVLFALLVGAALGLCGALSQGLFRNPLADPGLLGVTTGAACAAALCIVLLSSLPFSLPEQWRSISLPLAAFAGALLTCLLLDSLARWLTPGSVSGLLLTGIALNALAAACIGVCTYLSNDEQLRNLSFWTLGSLAAASWPLLATLSLLLLLACIGLPRLARQLNALALGSEAAQQSGVAIHRLRWQVVLTVAILTGAAMAWCGAISFIGLVAPHWVRMLLGADQRRVIPGAMLSGALLLLLADTLARTLALPAEIPIGILTALIGSPVLLLLLRQSRRSLY